MIIHFGLPLISSDESFYFKCRLPSRVGVGYRFFDSVTYTSLAKKMRTQLYSIASHHREKSLPKDDADENSSGVFTDPKSHIHDQTMHATLAGYVALNLKC